MHIQLPYLATSTVLNLTLPISLSTADMLGLGVANSSCKPEAVWDGCPSLGCKGRRKKVLCTHIHTLFQLKGSGQQRYLFPDL